MARVRSPRAFGQTSPSPGLLRPRRLVVLHLLAEGQDEAIGPFEDLQVEHAEEPAEAIVEVLAEPVEELLEDSEDSPEAAAQFLVAEPKQAVEKFPEETPEPVVSVKPLAASKDAPGKAKPKPKEKQQPSPGFDFLSGGVESPATAAEDDKLDDFFKGLS